MKQLVLAVLLFSLVCCTKAPPLSLSKEEATSLINENILKMMNSELNDAKYLKQVKLNEVVDIKLDSKNNIALVEFKTQDVPKVLLYDSVCYKSNSAKCVLDQHTFKIHLKKYDNGWVVEDDVPTVTQSYWADQAKKVNSDFFGSSKNSEVKQNIQYPGRVASILLKYGDEYVKVRQELISVKQKYQDIADRKFSSATIQDIDVDRFNSAVADCNISLKAMFLLLNTFSKELQPIDDAQCKISSVFIDATAKLKQHIESNFNQEFNINDNFFRLDGRHAFENLNLSKDIKLNGTQELVKIFILQKFLQDKFDYMSEAVNQSIRLLEEYKKNRG